MIEIRSIPPLPFHPRSNLGSSRIFLRVRRIPYWRGDRRGEPESKGDDDSPLSRNARTHFYILPPPQHPFSISGIFLSQIKKTVSISLMPLSPPPPPLSVTRHSPLFVSQHSLPVFSLIFHFSFLFSLIFFFLLPRSRAKSGAVPRTIRP